MAESRPAVALLFDDAELGAQLRQALQEQGVRIVHEGAVAGFDDALRQRLDPDVLVVNLDDEDDATFDRLMDMVAGERPRLVFNDASASRTLDGWDRARWARHLAVKVLAAGDVDPPRPADALAVEAIPAAPAADVPAAVAAAMDAGSHDEPPAEPSIHPVDPVNTVDPARHSAAMSDDLEAELAALLAAAESSAATADMPAPTHDELSFHDGDFSLALADDEPAVAAAMPVPATPAAPAGWSLVDHDALADFVDDGSPAAAEFGIEKLSAAEFLAPDIEPAAEDARPTMSLELISPEAAVAPQPREASEMLLDDLGGVPRRVVLLGAAANALDAVCDFLAALPAAARYTILLTQHFGEQPVEAVLRLLSIHSSLPVHLAEQGDRVRGGEVLLVPAQGQMQLRRDGSIELQPHDGAPSIDASFTMAANTFGRDALAIVFAGRSTDAVAGAQAIHDRGGQVWVEASHDGHFADMASGIAAERLVSYSGTLQELAAHLIEVHP